MKLFVQSHSGDENLEIEVEDREAAIAEIENIRTVGYYETVDFNDKTVFVPWHRIDFFRLT